MPWPMVHFAIATKISETGPFPSFLLGSIAPDAIHMRCLHYLSKNPDVLWKAFILGYFAHLYADLRWTKTLWAEFERGFSGNNNEIRQVYNNEMSQTEFNLLRFEDWSHSVMTKLQQAKSFTIEPFVTKTEVSQYRDLKLEWLQNEGNEPRIQPIYFTGDSMRDFIANTSQELNDLFKEWGITMKMRGIP